MMIKTLWTLPILTIGMASAAAAQTTSPGGPPQMSSGPLIIDQQRSDRQPVQAPVTPPPPPQQRGNVASQLGAMSSHAALKRVRIEGSTAPLSVLERAASAYVGRPLDSATINAVATAVSEAYGHGDVALYTIVVPNQQLTSGVLTLRVVEGYIADIVVTGDVKDRDLSLVKAYLARLGAERPLTRPTLERYLSLIRDIPGLKADIQLLNLETPGAVRLVLTLSHNDFDPRLAVNNRGTANLGRTQLQGNLNFNSLFRQGDQTQLSVTLPTDIDRFQYYALSHSTPIGGDGMRIGANIGYLRTRPEGYGYTIRGKAKSAGVNLSYPLKRSYKSNIYVSLGLDGLDSDNAAFGQLIASDHSRAVRAAASWSQSLPRQFASAALTLSKGLDILDASSDPRRTDLQFLKLNGQLGFNQMIGKSLAIRLNGSGQYSDDLLPGSEQFALGGDVIGRGFTSAYVVGDYGYGGSAELAWTTAPWPGLLKGSELYGFIDGGTLWTRARYAGLLPRQKYSLASAGGGMRLNLAGKMVVGLEAAKPIKRPYPFTSDHIRYTISWRTIY